MSVEVKRFNLLIGGETSAAISQKTFDAVNPSTGEVFAQIADASIENVDTAIAAARNAFDDAVWSGMSVAERGIYLKKIAQIVRKNAKELAELETLGVGKTSKHATLIDIPSAAETFDYFGSLNDSFLTKHNNVAAPVDSMTVRLPRGVIASISAWNYPLIFAAWKMAPALLAGNTIILKPAPVGSAVIARLGELINESGIPKGVINIITTNDNAVAEYLTAHSNVDMVSFTGGTETGSKVMEACAATTKKVVLELGGKSPAVVFADCDQDVTVGGIMTSIFMNQGQMCTACSRLYIEEAIYDQFVAELIKRVRSLTIGEASKATTEFGPLASVVHRNRILNMINTAVQDGAKVLTGGKIPEGFDKGAYLEPTILEADESNAIAREEVFGPVLTVFKFNSEDEVVKRANDSEYGLAASVWSKDLEKANRVATQIEAGTVWVNTYGNFNNEVGMGGFKRSGFGRELGEEGLLEYTHSKHICVDRTPGGRPLEASWF